VADAKAAVEMAKAEPQESGTESSYKTAVARERARKLKLENDTREREMISRAAVAAEIQRIAAGVAAVRVRAEQEWPRLFAGAGDSIPANAEVLRAMFDDLFVKFSELGRALALP
jgi:phage terminase Nu1 subunit (DNA packaging protein)